MGTEPSVVLPSCAASHNPSKVKLLRRICNSTLPCLLQIHLPSLSGLRRFTISNNEKALLDNISGGNCNGRRAREKFLEAIPSPSISLLASA
jgi:hypothetical protein